MIQAIINNTKNKLNNNAHKHAHIPVRSTTMISRDKVAHRSALANSEIVELFVLAPVFASPQNEIEISKWEKYIFF